MDLNSIDTPIKRNEYPSPISHSANRDQWKIASSSNRGTISSPQNKRQLHTSPSSSFSSNQLPNQALLSTGNSLGRSQSPFSRLDRYKSKSPIINIQRERQLTPQQHDIIDEETLLTDNNEHINEALKIVNDNRKTPKLEEEKQQSSKKTVKHITKEYVPWTWWSGTAFFLTCFVPNWALSTCGRKKTKLVQQAWREKVFFTLVIVRYMMKIVNKLALDYVVYYHHTILCWIGVFNFWNENCSMLT